MGTITGISDLDPVRWPNSHWRSVKVCRVVHFKQLYVVNIVFWSMLKYPRALKDVVECKI